MLLPDPISLCRHKIHYERTHTKEVEKHRDLVVHGPLVAQFLSDELRNVLGPEKSKGIASYKFRLNSPYYVDRAITLRGALGKNASGEEEWTVWAVDADGRSGVKGVVTLEAS